MLYEEINHVGEQIVAYFTIEERKDFSEAVSPVDLTGATITVYYIKPDATTGSVSGVIQSATDGTCYGIIAAATVDQWGEYTLWANNGTHNSNIEKIWVYKVGEK